MRGASSTSSTATSRRAPRRCRCGVPVAVALALVATCAPRAQAHGLFPDFVTGQLVVGDRFLEGSIIVLPELFDQWSGHSRQEPRSIAPGEGVALQADAAAIFGAALVVEIDGLRVLGVYDLPSIQKVLHNERWVEYLAFPVRFPLVAPPQRIGMVWSRWEGFPGAALDLVILKVEDALAVHELIFQEHEPEGFWTRPRPPGEAVSAPGANAARPRGPAPRPASGDLAVGGAFALAALVALAALWRGWRRMRAYTAVGAAVLLAVGLAFDGIRRGAVEAAPPPPDAAEARAIFEALQANVYRAFAYKRDTDVYDALAQSVGGALLDRIYVDVYRGLVMEDGGGARSRVDKVEFQDVAVVPPRAPAPDVFRVTSRWRVHGAVAHWGHEHRRVVEHVARFNVAREPDGWRIIHVEETEMPRVVARTVTSATAGGSGSSAVPPR